MKWESITEKAISDIINDAFQRMSLSQKSLWNIIQVPPKKWSQEPYGTLGGGFWVVAIFGNNIIWYNDIEEGFNSSTYCTYGKISEYGCDQDNLEWVVQHIIDEIYNFKK